MIEPSRPLSLQAYEFKVGAIQDKLDGHFIGYVRLPKSSEKIAGYIVIACNAGQQDSYKRENLTALYVAIGGVQFHDIEHAIEAAYGSSRQHYSPSGRDFHAKAALATLAAYARAVLEDSREPMGLPVLAIFFDRVGDFRLMDYTGNILPDCSATEGEPKVFVIGCFKKEVVRIKVNELLKSYLIDQKALAKLRRQLRKLTGCSNIRLIPVHRVK